MKYSHVLSFLLLLAPFLPLGAEETAFLHLGMLDRRLPAHGAVDLRFRLFDAPINGNSVGDQVVALDVPVVKGDYSVLLDFGEAVFDGRARWLEVAWRNRKSDRPFVELAGRQQLHPVPVAVHALAANRLLGVLPPTQLPPESARLEANQTFTGTVTFAPAAGAPFAVGSTSVVANLNADRLDGLEAGAFWQLGGNSATTPGVDFLGTKDDRPLELRVNNQRVARFEPHTNSPNIVMGFASNMVAPGAFGAMVLGGGALEVQSWPPRRTNIHANYAGTNFGVVVGGLGNTNKAEFGFLAGGALNLIEARADLAFLGGGHRNAIQSNAVAGVVVGGSANRLLRGSSSAFIGGGSDNSISNAGSSVIVGGFGNSIEAIGSWSFIGGGIRNTNAGRAITSVIGGGTRNLVATNARSAVVGGGARNVVNSNAYFAVVPGGSFAQAENYGQMAFASGGFALENKPGAAQTSTFVLRRVSTNDVPVELALDGGINVIRLRPASRWTFDALVTAGTTNGLTAGFHLRGVIKNLGGVTSMVGTPAMTLLGGDVGTEGWSITAEADDPRDALILRATGSMSHLIRWVATVRTAELIH